MDGSQLPIHERLNALIDNLDSSDSEAVPEDTDYHQYVERQAATALTRPHLTKEPSLIPESATENFNDEFATFPDEHASDFSDLELDNLVSDDADRFGEIDKLADSDAFSDDTSSEKASKPPKKNQHDEIIRSIYSEAGLDPLEFSNTQTAPNNQSSQPRRRTAKQLERDREDAARDMLRVERELVPEVGTHTVKSFPVADFLADLDGSDSEVVSDTKPSEPNSEITKTALSSPMRPPNLHNYVSAPQSRHREKTILDPHFTTYRHPAQPHTSSLTSDGDLEIVPDTKAGRLSRPFRDLLRNAGSQAGGSASDRKLALERAKLLKLQHQQSALRRQKRNELLAAQGVDVDEINQDIAQTMRRKAGGAESLLAHERENAEKQRQLEKQQQQHSGLSSSESESDDDLSADEGPPSESARRKKIVSDDEDESTDSESNNSGKPSAANREGVFRARRFANESEGTQIIPPVSSDVLANIMGLGADVNDDTTLVVPPEATFADSLSLSRQESGEEDLQIHRDDIAHPDMVTPDLRGVDRLPAHERLAVVRERFLAAQAEQRRQKHQSKPNKTPSERPPLLPKNNFVEDQAEESDDEDNQHRRLNNHSGDENEDDDLEIDQNADLDELVSREAKVKLRATELKRRYLEEEKVRDQKLLNKFVDGVHGGFRRRHQQTRMGDQFLSDDDLEFSDDETNYRLLIESKRKSNLLKSNQQVAQLAANQKAAAFFTSISEDLVSRPSSKRGSVQEGLDFLRSFDLTEHRRETVSDVSNINTDNYEELDHETARLPQYRATRKVTVQRPKTILERSQQIVKAGTYASRVNSGDLDSSRGVEITSTLGRSKQKIKPKARYVAPSIGLTAPKRRPVVQTKHKNSW